MIKLTNIGLATVAIVALLTWPVASNAQVYVPTIIPFTPPAVYPDGVPGSEEQHQSISEVALTQLEFTSKPERTKANLAQFIAKTRAQDASAAADLERTFATTPNIVDQIGNAMRGYDLDPHNVADAYGLWWLAAWHAANTRHDMPSLTTFVAVRDQARAAFASTAGFSEMGNADRQQLAEAFMIQATLLDAALEQVKGDAAQEAQLAEAAKRGAKESGLDLTTMTLTEQGFVPREGANAGDATTAADPLAEETPRMANAQAEDGDTPLYLGIAAALAAGLGGAYWLGRKNG